MVKIIVGDTDVCAYRAQSPEPILRIEFGPPFSAVDIVKRRETLQSALLALGVDEAVEYWGEGWAA